MPEPCVSRGSVGMASRQCASKVYGLRPHKKTLVHPAKYQYFPVSTPVLSRKYSSTWHQVLQYLQGSTDSYTFPFGQRPLFQSSQPTPNRELSSLLEWPRYEGGKLKVKLRSYALPLNVKANFHLLTGTKFVKPSKKIDKTYCVLHFL